MSEEKKTHRTYFNRGEFLCPSYSSANIWSKLDLEVHEDGRPGWPMGELKFTNCFRSIDFELSYSDEKEYKNSIQKLDTLIKHLSELKTALSSARVDYVLTKEAYDLKQKEKEKEDKEKEEEQIKKNN